MSKVSGFTFIHNALESGYPIAEAISAVRPHVDDMTVVNMESTDRTLELLHALASMGDIDNIVSGKWTPGGAGECLRWNHELNVRCKHDLIWHFEADEVFDDSLASEVARRIAIGDVDIAVWRLQVEQNFQRCRWYPTPVHRIFHKGRATKDGETTIQHRKCCRPIHIISSEYGFLWDITNVFRDNWRRRADKNAELWGHRFASYQFTENHSALGFRKIHTDEDIASFLADERWLWNTSPFQLPDILKPLVGVARYVPDIWRLGDL